MFSLIITIISIALVAALAVATIYYGGDAFNQGSSKAKASTIVNQAQQIAGANTLLRADTGAFAASIADLTEGSTKYLASLPAVQDLTTVLAANANRVDATGPALTLEVCQKIEEVAGRAAVVGANDSNQFGCYDNGGTRTFYFKG